MKKILVQLYLVIFGNKLKLSVNLINLIYFWLAKLKYGFTHLLYKDKAAIELRKNGFYIKKEVVHRQKIEKIALKVEELFKNKENLNLTYETSGLIHLKESLNFFPDLLDILNEDKVKKAIEHFLGTNFQLFSANIYRTFPSDIADNKFSSLYYHFDSMPSSHLKLMIYLNDTKLENGALKVVNRKDSLQLRNQGFWDRKISKHHDEIVEKTKILEGKRGDLIYFYPHDTIHKATLPEKGKRDIVNFILIPSLKKFHPKLSREQASRLSNNVDGYCLNPFKF